MTKHCSSGKCNSDERYHPNKKFAKFVQPKGHHPDLKRCQRWVHLMGRLDLSVEHINRTKYVCEDHFNEGVDLDYRTVILILIFFTFLKGCNSKKQFLLGSILPKKQTNLPESALHQ